MSAPSLLEMVLDVVDAVLGIRSIRRRREADALRLANRGLPNHCSRCGRDLRSVYDAACPACGKTITEIDRNGDPTAL